MTVLLPPIRRGRRHQFLLGSVNRPRAREAVDSLWRTLFPDRIRHPAHNRCRCAGEAYVSGCFWSSLRPVQPMAIAEVDGDSDERKVARLGRPVGAPDGYAP